MPNRTELIPWIALIVTIAGGAGALALEYSRSQNQRDEAQDEFVVKMAEMNSAMDNEQSEDIANLALHLADNGERIAALEAVSEANIMLHTDQRGQR